MITKDYLTLDEYVKFTGRNSDFKKSEDFKQYLLYASNILDVVTNNYFLVNEFEDTNDFVVMRFKKALCEQIKFLFLNNDANSSFLSNAIGLDVSSVSIGATSISYNKSGTTSTNSTSTSDLSTICKDALFLLNNTGLLYRGIL